MAVCPIDARPIPNPTIPYTELAQCPMAKAFSRMAAHLFCERRIKHAFST